MESIYKIKFTNGKEFNCFNEPSISVKMSRGTNRECLTMGLIADYEGIKESFVDGAQFSILALENPQIQEDEVLTPVSGVSIEKESLNNGEGYVGYEYFEYSVAGDITDNRDGTFTVIMSKKTEVELLEEENAALLFEKLTGEVF